MVIELEDVALLGATTIAHSLQIAIMAGRVWRMREKYKVDVPETNGPPEFIRTFRAHLNTIEWAPVFLPSMWMCGIFFHQGIAASLGVLYIYYREKYFMGYVQDASKRVPGFFGGARCIKALIALGMVGIIHNLVKTYTGIDFITHVKDTYSQ
ncbi:hypothetical protein CHS0354_019531 [Potamilus streckersoni]|uniref:Microsomal glutathione S-transferase 2 n=1 Tax=Potamilus streckersoni TaxID=2493646 RepID=A0AAE0SGZ6_9BIVA|nr:hypothetical protein CHS0354_019531 [Potamilus streckersoni]